MTMIKGHVRQLREDIRNDYQRKIDDLIAERDADLAAVDRLEDRLHQYSSSNAVAPSRIEEKRHEIKGLDFGKIDEPSAVTATAYQRVRTAIENYFGEFSSKDIWAAVNSDGSNKEIIANSFYPVFSKLLKDKDFGIVIIRKQAGKQPGIYKRSK